MLDINEPTPETKDHNKKSSKTPISIDAHDDGSVTFVYGNGKTKTRKGQSEDSFQQELKQFWTEGPRLQDPGWLLTQYEQELVLYQDMKKTRMMTNEEILEKSSSLLKLFNITDKINRNQLIHTAENQYYHRNYTKAIGILDTILDLIKLYKIEVSSKKEIAELENIKTHCQKKI